MHRSEEEVKTMMSIENKSREEVLKLVRHIGKALEYAAEYLKSDGEIVLATVTQNGRALCHAAKNLKANREIVLATVTQDGRALEYAAENLNADREIILAASSAPNARRVQLYRLISMNDLWGDEEILLRFIDLPLTFLFRFIKKYSNFIV